MNSTNSNRGFVIRNLISGFYLESPDHKDCDLLYINDAYIFTCERTARAILNESYEELVEVAVDSFGNLI